MTALHTRVLIAISANDAPARCARSPMSGASLSATKVAECGRKMPIRCA
jgi:hypothetical protein